MNDSHARYRDEVDANIASLGRDHDVQALSRVWVREIARHKYAYNYSWLGRPMIQFPPDVVAIQELVWQVRPDLVIETGIAHGGSLILSASLLALLDYCDAFEAGRQMDPRAPNRRVIGVDIDIRAHNRRAIEAHPLAPRIHMVQGSSVDPQVVEQVRSLAAGSSRVLVLLDSNHTHAHVLDELRAYAPLVSQESYCVVFDTLIELLPEDLVGDRPWGIGNSPMTAVEAYLAELAATDARGRDGALLRFEPDRRIDAKLLISAAPRGFLRRLPS
jgi:cephalosporin hydroxylase